jgi:hypothetical protein
MLIIYIMDSWLVLRARPKYYEREEAQNGQYAWVNNMIINHSWSVVFRVILHLLQTDLLNSSLFCEKGQEFARLESRKILLV